MKTTIEERLRQRFEVDARGFSMDPTLHPRVVRAARRRLAGMVSGICALAVVAVSVAALVAVRGQHEAVTTAAPKLRLVNYVADTQDPDGSGLQQYAQCMREQGFDVGDPVRTQDGWTITTPSKGFGTPAWREAAFVTCRMDQFVPRPGPGDLILGFPKATVTAYVSCLHDQGFDLPEPVLDSEGNYRFDLQAIEAGGVDTSSDAWARAAFVTCSPTDN
jgi:hypothetical protein